MCAKKNDLESEAESSKTNLHMHVCDALASFEARNLSDLESMRKNILEAAGKLSALMDEEQAALLLKKSQKEVYKTIIEEIKNLRTDIGRYYFGMPAEDLATILRIGQEIARKKGEQFREEIGLEPD